MIPQGWREGGGREREREVGVLRPVNRYGYIRERERLLLYT